MEQYLFRGIKEGTNEFVYGSLVNNLWSYSDLSPLKGQPVCHIIQSGECDSFEEAEYKDLIVEVIPSTVGMWSGLVDKNGNKIFEGDSVVYLKSNFKHAASLPKDTISWSGEIVFDSKNSSFAIKTNQQVIGEINRPISEWDEPEVDLLPYLSVFSNIHQSPELLNQSK